MSVNQARQQAQVQHLRQFKLHQATVQAQVQAQAQAERREAAQRAPVNGQFGAYGFRTLPQPTATQARPTRLPLRANVAVPSFRVPDKDMSEGLAGLMALLAELEDDARVDADGQSPGGRGGAGSGGDSGAGGGAGGGGAGGGASQEGAKDADAQGQGDSPGDEPGRDAGGGQSGSGHGDSARGDDGRGGHGREDGQGGQGGQGNDRGQSAAGLARRLPGADRRRDWVPLPQAGVQDLTPLLARFRQVQRPLAGAADGAHALASSLIMFGAATAPPGRPGVGALRLAAMAAYIDAQATPGALATLAGVKEVLLTQAVTARAAAASPAGARARNQWALLPLELLVCDKPRTGGQRRLAVERLQAAHGLLGRFKSPVEGRP
jgi:hypothetical protein